MGSRDHSLRGSAASELDVAVFALLVALNLVVLVAKLFWWLPLTSYNTTIFIVASLHDAGFGLRCNMPQLFVFGSLQPNFRGSMKYEVSCCKFKKNACNLKQIPVQQF